MNIRHTPASVAAPFGPYSHAVEVPEGSRLLYISGEVGVLPDGTVPETIEAQAEVCWRNIVAILADRVGANRRPGDCQISWVADSETPPCEGDVRGIRS